MANNKTQYREVNKLPSGAVTVKTYAESIGKKSVQNIYTMFERYLKGKGKYPGFELVKWQGVIFVINQ